MFDQPVSNAYFSGNSVMAGDGAMARRKGVITFRVVLVVGVALLLGILMAGKIFLTNQVTGLRADVAELESRKVSLEAESASLHTRWNRASSGGIVVKRARKELGLVIPEHPGLVLVCREKEGKRRGPWRKLKDSLPGSKLASVTYTAEEMLAGAMISLVPRGANAGTISNGGD